MTETILADLTARIKRLYEARSTISGEDMDDGYDTAAQWWADALAGTAVADPYDPSVLADPGDAADDLLDCLIPEQEARGAAFWGTELGRAIARLGKAPLGDDERVSGAIVAALLGITKQRVSELQKAGRLCTPQDVADKLLEVRRRG